LDALSRKELSIRQFQEVFGGCLRFRGTRSRTMHTAATS